MLRVNALIVGYSETPRVAFIDRPSAAKSSGKGRGAKKSAAATAAEAAANDVELMIKTSIDTLETMATLLDLHHDHLTMVSWVAVPASFPMIEFSPTPHQALTLELQQLLRQQLHAAQSLLAERARTCGRTAYAYNAGGYTAAASTYLTQAVELVDSHGQYAQSEIDSGLQLELQIQRARHELAHNNPTAAHQLATEALQHVLELQGSATLETLSTELRAVLAEALSAQGRLTQALPQAEQAFKQCSKLHQRAIATAATTAGSLNTDEAAAVDDDLDSKEGPLMLSSEQPDAVTAKETDTMDPLHFQWQLLRDFMSSLQLLARLELQAGRPRVALRYLQQAADCARQAGGGRARAWSLLLLADTQCSLQQFDAAANTVNEAEQLVTSAVPDAAGPHLQYALRVELLWRQGWLAQAAGQWAVALKLYDTCGGLLEKMMEPTVMGQNGGGGSVDRVKSLKKSAETAAPATPGTRGRQYGPLSSRYARLCGLRLLLQARLHRLDSGLQQVALRCPASSTDYIWLCLHAAQAHMVADAQGVQENWSLTVTAAAAASGVSDGLCSGMRQLVLSDEGGDGEADDLNALKVVDLKARLKDLGLVATGKKEELVARLQAALSTSLSAEAKPAATMQAEHPALPLLRQAQRTGPQRGGVLAERLVHLHLSQLYGRRQPLRALYHHHLGLGVAARMPLFGASEEEEEAPPSTLKAFASPETLAEALDALPTDVTVVGLAHDDEGCLIVSRKQPGQPPLLLRLNVAAPVDDAKHALRFDDDDDEAGQNGKRGASTADTVLQWAEKMASLSTENTRSIATPAKTDAGKAAWWEQRHRLEWQLQRFVQNMEAALLGCWRGLCLGRAVDDSWRQALDEEVRAMKEVSTTCNY